MSEPDVNNKEEYIRAFRQRLYASQAFHQTVAMMLAKERLAQDLRWEEQSRHKSRSLLKRLSTHVTTWLRARQKPKHDSAVKNLQENDTEPPWTIDAFYVVAENGTVSDVSSESPTKE